MDYNYKFSFNNLNMLTGSPCPMSCAIMCCILGSGSWCATAAATSSTALCTASSSTVGRAVGSGLLKNNNVPH